MSAAPSIEAKITELVAQHGTVPPPYFTFPDKHPFDIFWRMGAGEDHIMVFGAWWERQKDGMDEAQRIEYFRKFPPPPVWLTWMIELIWVPEDEEFELDPNEADRSSYFKRTEELGFGTEDECKHAWDLFNEEMEAEIKAREEKKK